LKNTFSINILFLVLAIIGFALIPMLSVQLHPSAKGSKLYVSYAWQDVSAEIVEKEVTSPLEGILASIKGLEEISSSSSKGRGQITLRLKEGVDMDAIRFEVGSMMRHVYSKLPDGVSRPRVSEKSSKGNSRQLLLTYTLNGEGNTLSLQKYAEEHIITALGLLEGVDQVEATGATPLEWELSYNEEQVMNLGVTINEIRQAITTSLESKELGGANIRQNDKDQFIYLSFKGQAKRVIDWEQVIVKKQGGRLLYLTDLVKVRLKEQEPRSYFRINGLNTIYLNIYSINGANQINVAQKVRDKIRNLENHFPENFSLIKSYDASEELKDETDKILLRSGLAIVILLLFVLLISRQWRYLVIIGTSLIVNLSVAVIFFYWLQIDIHIYSLAGLTVSLGIIIDNTIVMVDHIRSHRNRRVFLAILAATLTTIGALSIIFLLKEEQRVKLVDFALVMLVNLVVSLFVALFFIPAFMDKFPLRSKANGYHRRRRHLAVRLTNNYERFILFSSRRKWLFILIAIWGFGIPVHLLPDKLGHERQLEEELNTAQRWYNQTLGNTTFVGDVKPWLNRILGGSLYYFSSYMDENGATSDNQRTRLTVNVSMPDGATLQQMNTLFLDLENFLAGFDEIETFVSRIHGIDRSSVNITFKKEAENGSFPYYLKQMIETKAVETGGADFGVFGVGRGFSNKLHEGYHNSSIALRGYNYDELMKHARFLKKELLNHQRIKEVFVRTENRWYGKPRYEFVADVNLQKLAYQGSSIGRLFQQLSPIGLSSAKAGYVPFENEFIPVVLKANDNDGASIWHLKNHPVKGNDGQYLKFENVADLKKERVSTSINKVNQEYKLSVTYDFIGPYQLSERVLKKNIEMINEYLPLGYSAKNGRNNNYWNYGEKSQYGLLFLVMVIIYFICAILLESLLQPLAVIATIPLSFIGVFLSFALFKFPFDQGGYASMVLLCGLSVNSALYILNDYNDYRRQRTDEPRLKQYLKAYNHKITPVLLTVLSTSLGLIPFLIGGRDEGFWFSLAVGAIGGLIFSLLAMIIWLPLLVVSKKRILQERR